MLRELTKEEGDALTKDLQDVLAKHDAELGVSSSITLMKRVDDEGIPSPAEFITDDTNPETKSGG